MTDDATMSQCKMSSILQHDMIKHPIAVTLSSLTHMSLDGNQNLSLVLSLKHFQAIQGSDMGSKGELPF